MIEWMGGDVLQTEADYIAQGVATQPDMYRATLPYLNRAQKNLAKHCAKHSIGSVALPKIGAGLGKLDWETEVKPLMLRHLSAGATRFLVYEDFKLAYERTEL